MNTVVKKEVSSVDLGDFTIKTMTIEYEGGIVMKVRKNICNRCGELAERLDDLPGSPVSCPCYLRNALTNNP